MAIPIKIELAGGKSIPDAYTVAYAKFERFRWAWYDGVRTDPGTLDPVDFAITIAMNSRATAGRMKDFMEHADAIEKCLQRVPLDVALTSETRQDVFEVVEKLFEAACKPLGTKLAVASKVLHRKRPKLIPMLDSVIVDYYLPILKTSPPSGFPKLWLNDGSWSDPTWYMKTMAGELEQNRAALAALRRALNPLVPDTISDVRLFEATLYGYLTPG